LAKATRTTKPTTTKHAPKAAAMAQGPGRAPGGEGTVIGDLHLGQTTAVPNAIDPDFNLDRQEGHVNRGMNRGSEGGRTPTVGQRAARRKE
jgi:hypothetical protein